MNSSDNPSGGLTDAAIVQSILPVLQFLEETPVFNLVPSSGLCVVLDHSLPVTVAFTAAIENDVSFAILWNRTDACYAGLITVTDLIHIILQYFTPNSQPAISVAAEGNPPSPEDVLAYLDTLSIAQWRARRHASNPTSPTSFVCIHPEASLLAVLRALHANKINRIPVTTSDAVAKPLLVASSIGVLGYLAAHQPLDTGVFLLPIDQLQIGLFNPAKLVVGRRGTALRSLLEQMTYHKLSALPIVDDQGVLAGVISRHDVLTLLRNADFDIEEALRDGVGAPLFPGDEDSGKARPQSVFTCAPNDSLGKVIAHLARTGVRRLIIVDDNNVPCGVVTSSDIFKFFVSFSAHPAVIAAQQSASSPVSPVAPAAMPMPDDSRASPILRQQSDVDMS